ncbi:hypothetical protein KUR45_005221 [Escherichia coli]|nr:hypothetical protein [Escherichia coli]
MKYLSFNKSLLVSAVSFGLLCATMPSIAATTATATHTVTGEHEWAIEATGIDATQEGTLSSSEQWATLTITHVKGSPAKVKLTTDKIGNGGHSDTDFLWTRAGSNDTVTGFIKNSYEPVLTANYGFNKVGYVVVGKGNGYENLGAGESSTLKLMAAAGENIQAGEYSATFHVTETVE